MLNFYQSQCDGEYYSTILKSANKMFYFKQIIF